MKMVRCKSSNIDSFGWENGELEVKFLSGETYRYHKVPHLHFRKMKQCVENGLSIGSYFSTNVKKSGYIYEKLPIDYEPKETMSDQLEEFREKLKAKGIGYEQNDESGEARFVLNEEAIKVMWEFMGEKGLISSSTVIDHTGEVTHSSTLPSKGNQNIVGGGGVKVK